MPASAKDRQISVRIPRDTDAWLERRAGGGKNKAGFVRQLIEREKAREREQELLAMFNRAAADLNAEDRAERESLLGAQAQLGTDRSARHRGHEPTSAATPGHTDQ